VTELLAGEEYHFKMQASNQAGVSKKTIKTINKLI